MGTIRVVNARFRDNQPLDRFSAKEMAFHNFLYVTYPDAAVPYRTGINYETGAVFALIKATASICAGRETHTTLAQGPLEGRAEEFPALCVTATSGMIFGALVPTYEEMVCEFWHKQGGLGLDKWVA